MKYSVKKYAAFAFALLCLAATSCSKDEPKDKPDTPVVKPDEPLKGTIELKQSTLLMSEGESMHISKLLKETEANLKKLTFEVSGGNSNLKIVNGRVKALKAGELDLIISYGEQVKKLSILVVNARKPIDMEPEELIKYVWDYKKSPKSIVNKTGRPLIIDFWAPWCNPCKGLVPKMRKIAADYNGKVLVLKINADPKGKNKIYSEVYDAFYFSSEELSSQIVDKKGRSLLPTIIYVSKGKQAPKGLVESEVFVPTQEYMDVEFAD